MLVLSRKTEQRIRIGDDITIIVKDIRANTVRIGIEAPQGVNIVRSELLTESAAHGSRHEAERMDCEGQEAPPFDHEPLLVGGKYSL